MHQLAKSLIIHCAELGVAEWVICPGARNVALLSLLSRAQGVKLWHHFDERAAGFFAIGRMQASGRPVAVLTTSGTAAAELLPAVIEAHYQGRPLIVVTADREPEFRGSGAPQAIVQPGLFGDYTAIGMDIFMGGDTVLQPPVSAGLPTAPIHYNICLPEPDLGLDPPMLDLEPAIGLKEPPFKENVGELVRFLRNETWKGLVVLLGGLEQEDQEPTLWLLEQLGAPVLADATSGLRESLGHLSLRDGDHVLKHNRPHAVLRIGDIPTSRFWRDLEFLPDVPVFSLTRTGYSGLAKRPSQVIKGSMERIVRAIGDVFPIGDIQDILPQGRKRGGRIEELLFAYPESETALVYSFSLFASLSDLIYLGNSMPIREWNLAAQWQTETVNVRANRGANGIDGQIATFLGASAECETSWALLGDLTALYDANAPALNTQLPKGKRIIAVINNKGGMIFDRLPGAETMNDELKKLLIQPHHWRIRSLAELWGADYKLVHTTDDFDFEPREGLTFVEIIPEYEQTCAFWSQYT